MGTVIVTKAVSYDPVRESVALTDIQKLEIRQNDTVRTVAMYFLLALAVVGLAVGYALRDWN
jgi:ABC-type transport system involved in cytochrome c biogenesis permease component